MEEEVVNILRHYRHDLINKLQIVHGYLTMKKYDKLGQTLDELFKELDEERKLLHLGIPQFTLWVVCFNTSYSNFRLSYKIHTNTALPKEMDTYAVSVSQSIMKILEQCCKPFELHEMNLEISEKHSEFLFEFHINGILSDINSLIRNEKDKVRNNFEIINDNGDLIIQFRVSKSK